MKYTKLSLIIPTFLVAVLMFLVGIFYTLVTTEGFLSFIKMFGNCTFIVAVICITLGAMIDIILATREKKKEFWDDILDN